MKDQEYNAPNEKPVIFIDEKPDNATTEVDNNDAAFIAIESNDEPLYEHNDVVLTPNKHHRLLPWIVGTAVLTAIFCVLLMGAYHYYRTYINIGVPVSVKSDANIALLQKKWPHVTPEVVMSSDSVLGVGLNFYELRGLKGEISFAQPDTTDANVYLYCRCNDVSSYQPDNTNPYIGSLVVRGKSLQSDATRLGYCAMANNNVVIGVARDEKVKDYCEQQGGSFFRQFILVSNGVLPPQFYLHGKVERRALGRMGNQLYYIESRNPETMWAFADALREYGFTDAIYITGGTDYDTFYRTKDGVAHPIGHANKMTDPKGKGIVPWLVFKK